MVPFHPASMLRPRCQRLLLGFIFPYGLVSVVLADRNVIMWTAAEPDYAARRAEADPPPVELP